MESRSYAAIAVSFLVVFIVGIGVVVAWLHRGKPETRYYDIVSPYSVSGLQPQAAVRLKGLLVGHVKDIGFDPADPDRVRVRIALYPDTYVTRATYAELSYQGFTGLANISLVNPPGATGPRLATSAAHPATIPMHRAWLQALTSAAKPELDQAGDVLRGMRELLDPENRRHVARILARLDSASAQLATLEGSLAPTVQALPGIAQRADRLLRESQRLVAQARALAAAAPGSVKQVGRTAASVGKLSDASRELVRQLSRTVAELDAAIARIQRTTRDVDRLSRELQRRPESVLFGPAAPPPGPGEPGFHPPPARAR